MKAKTSSKSATKNESKTLKSEPVASQKSNIANGKTEIVLSDEDQKRIQAAVSVAYGAARLDINTSAIIAAVLSTMVAIPELLRMITRVLFSEGFTEAVTASNTREAVQALIRASKKHARYVNDDGRLCYPIGVGGGGLYRFREITSPGMLIRWYSIDMYYRVIRDNKPEKVTCTDYYEATKDGYAVTHQTAEACDKIAAEAKTVREDKKAAQKLENAKDTVREAGFEIVEKCTYEEAFNRLAAQNPTKFRKLCENYVAKFGKSNVCKTKKDA